MIVIMTRKKKVLVVCWAQPSVTILSHISKDENYELCILAGFFVTTGKKNSSHLSGGCGIIITTGKKNVLVVCLAGA